MTRCSSPPSYSMPPFVEPVSAADTHAGPVEAAAVVVHSPHDIEFEVQHRLQNHPGLKFSRLNVHRSERGICLEGFLESNEYEVDLCDVVRSVEGVTSVINRVVLTRPGSGVPKKG